MKKAFENKWYVLLAAAAVLGVALVIVGIVLQNRQNQGQNRSDERRIEEEEIACFLKEAESVREVTVKLRYDEQGAVCGAAVICPQAEDPRVKKEIIDLLSALLGIGTNKICVTSG